MHFLNLYHNKEKNKETYLACSDYMKDKIFIPRLPSKEGGGQIDDQHKNIIREKMLVANGHRYVQ